MEKYREYMIAPRKLAFEAKKKENENLRFRIFLKGNADEEELDRQFAELHAELFEKYDCSRCRNCCKSYHAELTPHEVGKAAEHLNMDVKEFIQTYLDKNDMGDKYESRNAPCDFFQEDGNCVLGEYKPDSCKKYPYTNQPERMQSLFGLLNIIAVCPVAYEIWERLKDMYHFR